MKITLLILMIFISSLTYSADFSFEAGIRQQSGDSKLGSTQSGVGYQLGGTGLFPLTESLNFKSGFFYTQRPILVKSGAADITYQFTSFDVPIALQYNFESVGGVFAGVVVSNTLDKTCSGVTSCSVTEAKSMTTPFILGGSFRFAPQIGLSVYFENAGAMAKDLDNYKAVGVNFTFLIE